MKNLLTISTTSATNYRNTVSGWLERDAKLLSCGTHLDEGDVMWWAIAETDMPVTERYYFTSNGSRSSTVDIDDEAYKKLNKQKGNWVNFSGGEKDA